MTYRILSTLIICLLAYQTLIGVPYALIKPDCFNDKYDHYPQWFEFPDDYMDALREATQSGTSIGCFYKPKGDRAGCLWNERWDNEVVSIEGDEINLGEIDYLYLRPDELDQGWMAFCRDRDDLFELIVDNPRWGTIYRCK